MFSVIKGLFSKIGLQWFEWLFIGLLLTTIGVCYFLYQQVGSLKGDLAEAKVVMKQGQHNEDQLEETIEIDRAINYEFMNDQVSSIREQYEQREQVLDRYLKLKNVKLPPEPEPESKPEPQPEPETEITVEPKPTPKPTPVKETNHVPQESPPDDLAGLQHLVDSMQLAYCRAKPTDASCATAVSDQ